MTGFTPGRTVLLDVGSSSVSVPVHADSPSLRLLNVGNDLMFIRTGTGPQAATVEDYPLQPNVPEIINKGVGADTIAAICGGLDQQQLYVTAGVGS